MRNRACTLAAALVLAVGALPVRAAPLAQVSPPAEVVEDARGSYIFVFDDTVPPRDIPERAQALLRAEGAQPRQVFNTAIRGFSANLPPQAAARIAAQDGIAYYEPNGVAFIIAPPVEPAKPGNRGGGPGPAAEPPQETPWGVTRVGGPRLAGGRRAWVIDTGIDLDHPDLRVGAGKSFAGGKSADDGNGHGTHVAGTIAALDNDIDVVGVAAGATVHPVRVLGNSGFGTIDAVVAGVDYVAANASEGDCANLSLGASGHFQSLHDAVLATAKEPSEGGAGVRFALAAGNETAHAGGFEPAHVEHANVYTVSAIGSLDLFAFFSNYGNPPVDFAAPGVDILSTRRGGGVTTMSGTSMAAPHVCGILLFGAPEANGAAVGDPDLNADPIAHF